jgi:hypothetical protein
MSAEITFPNDFPGANIIVERVDGDTVYLRQDLRDTVGDWFYWNFKVQGAANRTVTFRFTLSDVIGARGPAVSADGGKSWHWLGSPDDGNHEFTYAFGASDHEMHFAFAPPYLHADFHRFLATYRSHPAVAVQTLCTSPKGRDVELLRVGKLDGDPSHRMSLTARHHACESIASFALEGFLTRILSETSTGAWFRDHVEIIAVPFVDKDGVEEGDQGKNRAPHDHNRDYASESIYSSVAAIRELLPSWSQGLWSLALDLHCPYRLGPDHEVVQFVEPFTEDQASTTAELARLSTLLEQSIAGLLPYESSNNLRLGQSWNVRSSGSEGRTFADWASSLPEMRLAVTVEIPYANAGGVTVTGDAARALGGDLAEASRRFLQDTAPQTP